VSNAQALNVRVVIRTAIPERIYMVEDDSHRDSAFSLAGYAQRML
jgi:hypothetical protein